MNLLEYQLDYPFGEQLPEAAETLCVAPGVYWLRMPLPFALDHINLWLLRDKINGVEGWTAVDCGAATTDTTQRWEQVFNDGLNRLPILRVVVTHCHPDHLGLASWLCAGGDQQRWTAPLWISHGEFALGRLLNDGSVANVCGDAVARHYRLNGLTDPDVLERVRNRENYYTRLVPTVPERHYRLMDNDCLCIGGRKWRIVAGYGHSPEHCALYCEDDALLISGDMILPRISTNVSVFDMEPDGNPLALYLASLERYATMRADTLVLPSHGKPFIGVRTRVKQLQEHHADRLKEVLESCSRAACSAADIVPVMFKRELDMHQMAFALGEALAHLHVLWHQGTLERSLEDDGVLRFKVLSDEVEASGTI
jgi:glyoxylase-like metal-dependent hydrolase (beta-lactamase superfamily II)